MHLQTVAATLLVAGAAASPFSRQTSNETYCEEDLPETTPSATSAHNPPFPVNTTIPGVPSNPGAGGYSPPNPGKPSNPGGNSPPYPGKPSNPGGETSSNPGKPSTGGNSPSTPGGSGNSNTPSYPGKPSTTSEAACTPDDNSPSNPGGNPGGNSPPYPGSPSAPSSSARPWVPYPQNTSVASVIPSFTNIPDVVLPTVPTPSTTIPAGNNNTASVPIPSSSAPATKVPYGVVISSCTVPGDFALTFDDGPFIYTNHVLDLLAEAGVKATFFVNGKNFGDINDEKDVVKRMIADGHQIGSHTYSHADLATLGDAEVIAEMTKLEDALINIIGKYPTYMRPPYFSWNDNTLSILKALGYHVIRADIDTLDYANDAPLGNLASVRIFKEGVDDGGSIALAHDVHENTAEYLVPEFLRIIKKKGLKAVTVGECLGDPEANWYKTKRTSTPTATASKIVISITSTATPTGVIGPGGACGGSEGYVCKPGFCCSQYGFCGSSEAYCGAGCQPSFGVCGPAVAPPAPSGGSAAGTASAPAATKTSASGIIGPGGACGGPEGYICEAGFCCSEYGFCGTSQAYCGAGCQPLFGVCGAASGTGTASAPAATKTGGIGPDGACGGSEGYICKPGFCCSQYGFCGSSEAYCGAGCQPSFGICGAAPAPAPAPPGGSATGAASTPAATQKGATGGVSPDGSCGGTNGYTCPSSNCCSQYGFCGSTSAYCGAGCQPLFGVCGAAAAAPATGTASAPAATQKGATGGVSPDGSCGGTNGYTCPSSTCCSQYGFCGSTAAHCGAGCQPLFGKCS